MTATARAALPMASVPVRASSRIGQTTCRQGFRRGRETRLEACTPATPRTGRLSEQDAPRESATVSRSVVVIAATRSTCRTGAARANRRGPTVARHALTRAIIERKTKSPSLRPR